MRACDLDLAWQMSVVGVCPGALRPHRTAVEYRAGVAWISNGLSTRKLAAATPPNVTLRAPVNPEPRIVTGAGAASEPPYGLTPVTAGTGEEPFSSTYCSVLARGAGQPVAARHGHDGRAGAVQRPGHAGR